MRIIIDNHAPCLRPSRLCAFSLPFHSSLHISPEELWPSGTGPCNLWTARLFPLLHPSTPEQQQAAWWLAKMAQGEVPSAEVRTLNWSLIH